MWAELPVIHGVFPTHLATGWAPTAAVHQLLGLLRVRPSLAGFRGAQTPLTPAPVAFLSLWAGSAVWTRHDPDRLRYRCRQVPDFPEGPARHRAV